MVSQKYQPGFCECGCVSQSDPTQTTQVWEYFFDELCYTDATCQIDVCADYCENRVDAYDDYIPYVDHLGNHYSGCVYPPD